MIFRWDFSKNQHIGGLPKKGAWTVCRFNGGKLGKKEGVLFLGCWCPNAHYDDLAVLREEFALLFRILISINCICCCFNDYYSEILKKVWSLILFMDQRFCFPFLYDFFFFFEKDTDSVVILLEKYDFFDPSFYNTPVLKEATFLRVFQSSSVKTQLWGWEEAGKTMKC